MNRTLFQAYQASTQNTGPFAFSRSALFSVDTWQDILKAFER
jgi:hypothetical protein